MIQKNTIYLICAIVTLLGVIAMMSMQLSLLESELATKNIEYEWLSEIVHELIDGKTIEELRPVQNPSV